MSHRKRVRAYRNRLAREKRDAELRSALIGLLKAHYGAESIPRAESISDAVDQAMADREMRRFASLARMARAQRKPVRFR